MNEYAQHHQRTIEDIQQLTTLDALEEVRIRLLGKKGEITEQMKTLGALDPESRRQQGAALNAVKDQIVAALEKQKTTLMRHALDQRLVQETVDVSLPARPSSQGTLHPITRVIEDLTQYFAQFGFSVVEGPDVENEDNNFTALNIPEHHPARQMHDTFYVNHKTDEPKYLLRTHTSSVAIRALKSQKPPIRIIAPGRAYRCDLDATHSPMFHQMDLWIVDEGIHMGHLKSCVIDFCRNFFEVDNLPVRFRPSFFPFTEPSAEVDIGYSKQGNELKIGGGEGWLEILGCGMIHPKVLKNCGIDPDRYQGFAFGMGIDRIAMLKYGISDIRTLCESDLRWLRQQGFSSFSGV